MKNEIINSTSAPNLLVLILMHDVSATCFSFRALVHVSEAAKKFLE